MGSLGIFRPLFKLNLSTRNQVGGQIQTRPCVRVMEAAAAFQVTKTRYEHSQGLKFVAQFRSSDLFLFIPQSALSVRLCQGGDWEIGAHLLCKQSARFPCYVSSCCVSPQPVEH